ncbi:MAG: hypothetical protein GY868_15735 [Deltaproteobacteria bacterium]|nr:hypothetical protein [Deltaproteobacteria bacterium]
MMDLISGKLVKLVEQNTDTILQRWIDRLKSDPATTSFSENDLQKFKNKARMVLEELGQWVSYETPKENVGRKYANEGMGLFRMKIPLCEGIRAMVLLKRTLWLFVVYESAFDSALKLNQMRELNDRVLLFFDRATYYFIRGYMEELNRKIKTLWNLSDEDTREVFFEKSFYGHDSS